MTTELGPAQNDKPNLLPRTLGVVKKVRLAVSLVLGFRLSVSDRGDLARVVDAWAMDR